MNKIGLIKKLATVTQLKEKHVSLVIENMLTIVSENLVQGEIVRLAKFGTFKTRERAERIGQLPKTRENVLIPGGRIALFVAGKRLRERLLVKSKASAVKKHLKIKVSKKKAN